MVSQRGRALRLAYLADRYPRINETFIYGEVAALRTLDVHVETFSLWLLAPTDIADATERETTTYLRPASLFRILAAHLRLATDSPGRYGKTLWLAIQMARPREALLHFGYAGLLAREVALRRLTHLHNHATGASCTVAMLAAALGDFPFSFTVHGPGIFFAPVERRLAVKLRRAQFVRAISNFTRGQCLLWAHRSRWKRVQVIHCGIDPKRFTPRPHVGRGAHLLFVGRLVAEKGLPVLFDVLAQLRASRPQIRLTIVGSGPDGEFLRGLAESSALSPAIDFIGYQPPTEVAALMREADVFVLPSLAEGVPVVLMEAMASGLPVVATNVGGVSELVEDSANGYVVPAAEPETMAARIETLLDDADLRNRFGRAGRAKVIRDFHVLQTAAALRDLYAEAASESHQESRG